jgi:lysyl-tRNA synthetase class 2
MPRWKELKDNPKLRQNLEKRAAVIKAIRAFFDSRGYLEVETPIMVAKPGMEPHLEPFETETIDPKGNRYRSFLITSPEYAMKKLLAAGFPRIYQLTKCFRNGEDFGGRHNPEFTMLEWYRAGADYRDLMEETEELVAAAGKAVGRTFAWPFERLSVETAFRKYADRDALELAEDEPEYHRIFLNEIEPRLGEDRPTFLHDYPASMAALSRTAKDPRFAERFELYIDGLEVANAFSELTDAKEQKRRLEEEREFRKKLGRNPYDLDLDFIAALESGMPESAGIALGVDRLVMALLGEKDIGRTLAFPASDVYTSGE